MKIEEIERLEKLNHYRDALHTVTRDEGEQILALARWAVEASKFLYVMSSGDGYGVDKILSTFPKETPDE